MSTAIQTSKRARDHVVSYGCLLVLQMDVLHYGKKGVLRMTIAVCTLNVDLMDIANQTIHGYKMETIR